MKKFFLVVAALASSVAVFATDFVKRNGEYVSEDTLSFDRDAASLARLEVETVNGGVTVKGWDVASIHIVAYRTVRCENSDEGRKYLEKFELTLKERGSTLVIETEFPKWDWLDSEGDISGIISYEISAPRTLAVEAETVNGGVEVSGMSGEVELSSVNGGIELDAPYGLTGRATLSTVNGGIEVLAKSVVGKSELESVNGGIEMRVTSELNGDIEVTTVNGGIEVVLPQNSDMRLKADVSMSGGIDSDWGESVAESMFGETLEYTAGTGEHRVSIDSVNGSIEIRSVKAN